MSQSIPKWAVIQKKRGETPLQTLGAWKAARPELKDVPASYAGRLDPMAEGKLLVLLGDECKRQHIYTQLDKEYEVELVLDLKTDSGDVLGLAEYARKQTIVREHLGAAVSSEIGTYERQYPIFSSKTVKGIPLFRYYFENRLSEIQIPTHEERIYAIKLLKNETVTREQLAERISDALSVVPRSNEPSKVLGADFRQDAIRARWQELFTTVSEREFTILCLRVTCGSGSYMRTLAERIGASLGTTAFAISINRTRIGHYMPLPLGGLWTKQY